VRFSSLCLLWRGNADREASLHTQRSKKKTSGMSKDKCERCGGGLIEIDHWGERLRGCPTYAIAGRLPVENGADSRLTTSWRCELSKNRIVIHAANFNWRRTWPRSRLNGGAPTSLRRLFFQAVWTTFRGITPNASSVNARERPTGGSHAGHTMLLHGLRRTRWALLLLP
jgi:hypothetical protein